MPIGRPTSLSYPTIRRVNSRPGRRFRLAQHRRTDRFPRELLTENPRSTSDLNWLDNPQVPELLADLAAGQVGLSHEALHELPNWRTVAYLRDLFMSSGTLPVLGKQLLHFQTWLHHRLAEHASRLDPDISRPSRRTHSQRATSRRNPKMFRSRLLRA